LDNIKEGLYYFVLLMHKALIYHQAIVWSIPN